MNLKAYRGILSPLTDWTADGQRMYRSTRNSNYYLLVRESDEPLQVSAQSAYHWFVRQGLPVPDDPWLAIWAPKPEGVER